MLSPDKIVRLKKQMVSKNIQLTKIFKALSEPNRCKIFWMFATEDVISVGNAAQVLGISMPLASQHLKILLQNGLLRKEKQGQKVFYELKRTEPVVKTLLKILK